MKILVTGGAGYVGAALVPQLLARGHDVRVLDLYLFGEHVFDGVREQFKLDEIKGDLRDIDVVQKSVANCDAVIHLACISNDPSFELNPALGKSINFDAFEPLVHFSKQAGVERFIYASSSSVYGLSSAPEVTEDHPLEPLTDYSRYKMLCEPLLLEAQTDDFAAVVVRPATVCGYSARQRMDLAVNILTNHAVNTRTIRVFGGAQKRPNIHIQDMVDAYLMLIERNIEDIRGKTYNIGGDNFTISQIANKVADVVSAGISGPEIALETVPTDDQRSYHISSDKIRSELGFVPRYTIENAVSDLLTAFAQKKLPDSMTDSRYFNIKRMQEISLT